MARARHRPQDDDLQIHLRGRQEGPSGVRVPSLGTSPPVPRITAVVKVGYMRAGRMAGYATYIERDGTAGPARGGETAVQGYSGYIGRDGAGTDGQRAYLFTREGETVDREAFINRSRGDPRAWTIIVSPGRNTLDMDRYVRAFMRQLELDLGKRFDWIAATHRNTAFTHSHILLRGKDAEGRAFRIPPAYLQRTIRQQATTIAQLFVELGYMQERPTRGSPPPPRRELGDLQRAAESWMRQHAQEGRGR